MSQSYLNDPESNVLSDIDSNNMSQGTKQNLIETVTEKKVAQMERELEL